MNCFKTCHPIVNFTFFFFVIMYSMLFMNPVMLVISLICAVGYSIVLKGQEAVKFGIFCIIPILLVSAVMNPLFNHEGVTILAYFKSGNPLTLESIIYGIFAAVMIVCVIEWFSCFNNIMTSDKIIYLFGKIIPSFSLILSMTLRFVPKFRTQLKVVINAQRCIGRDVSEGTVIKRAKCAITILSVMITWMLENAIDTADSMKSRGYGLSGRTAFSNYIISTRDKYILSYILILGIYIFSGNYMNFIEFKYFPKIVSSGLDFMSISIYIAYFMLCSLPIAVEKWEEIKWKATE